MRQRESGEVYHRHRETRSLALEQDTHIIAPQHGPPPAGRKPVAELVAWLCLAGLVALSAHWTVYTHALASLGGAFDPQVASLDPQWVVIAE